MTTPRTGTHWLPVLGVLLLAPWFAEMSWGGYPFTDIPAILLFLSPLYGAAALLIREVARRAGRGWPTILLLAAAFGVLQAGIVDQSLFNPSYDRYDFQHPVHVGGIDISLYYLLAFVAGHVVASIAAPIALAEAWSRRSLAHTPWLGRRALSVTAVVFVLASTINHIGVKEDQGKGFQAAPLQTLAAAVTVLALVTVAVRWRPQPATAVRVPPRWTVLAIGFAAYLLYLPAENAAAFAVGVTVVALVVGVVGTWSRSGQWSEGHTTALAMGSVLTGLVVPFWGEPYDPSVSAGTEMLNDTVTTAICLAIVVTTIYRRRTIRTPAVTSGP